MPVPIHYLYSTSRLVPWVAVPSSLSLSAPRNPRSDAPPSAEDIPSFIAYLPIPIPPSRVHGPPSISLHMPCSALNAPRNPSSLPASPQLQICLAFSLSSISSISPQLFSPQFDILNYVNDPNALRPCLLSNRVHHACHSVYGGTSSSSCPSWSPGASRRPRAHRSSPAKAQDAALQVLQQAVQVSCHVN